MGLAAREIERQGTPTVALSILREATEKTPPPRALFLRRPFGHALGAPGNREEQLATLVAALRLMVEAPGPGTLRDAPFRWRRDRFAEPDWEALAKWSKLPPQAAR